MKKQSDRHYAYFWKYLKIRYKSTYRTKACQSFFEQICLDWVYSLDHYVKADVELFTLDQQRIFDVALHEELIVVCISGQVMEFLDE